MAAKPHPKNPHFDLNPMQGISHTIEKMGKHGLPHMEVALVLFGGWGLGLAASAIMAYGLLTQRMGLFSIGLVAQIISLVGPWAYLGARVFLKHHERKKQQKK